MRRSTRDALGAAQQPASTEVTSDRTKLPPDTPPNACRSPDSARHDGTPTAARRARIPAGQWPVAQVERRAWDSNPRGRGYRPSGFQDPRIFGSDHADGQAERRQSVREPASVPAMCPQPAGRHQAGRHHRQPAVRPRWLLDMETSAPGSYSSGDGCLAARRTATARRSASQLSGFSAVDEVATDLPVILGQFGVDACVVGIVERHRRR
jgi:hypothetical protein